MGAPDPPLPPADEPLFPRWLGWVLAALVALAMLWLLARAPNPAPAPLDLVLP